MIRYINRNLSMIIGLVMFIMIVGISIFAPIIAPYDPLAVKPGKRMQSPGSEHLLGTDFWGRDILSRVIYGGRSSLVIGLVSIGVALVIGGSLGIIAGYYSGLKIISFIIWITDILMSFPTIILGAIVGIMFGPGLFNTIIAIAIAFVPRFIRLTRGNTLSAKEDIYITAARSLGMSDLRIIGIHLLPNIISPVIVMAVIWTSAAITIEVALSFLGLGVRPPTPSWGTVLQDNLRIFVMQPSAVVWPCIALAWTVQALNLMGDRFRDVLDPKMR
jgi:peptide/nickel transport system permease protein